MTSICLDPISQNRVGMGVPSASSGALRMTTGTPAPSRTTTVNAVFGNRSNNAVTAARSSGDACS